MIRLTLQTVIMMVETAVSTSTLITVLNASVFTKIIVHLDILHQWLVTVFVMMRPTMKIATLTVETVVDALSTRSFALIVYVILMKLV